MTTYLEFSNDEYQPFVESLKSNGRSSLAVKLADMLCKVSDDHEEPAIDIGSLRQMANFFIDQRDLPDPFIGPDGRGTIYAQWRVYDDGVLVVGFLGNQTLRLVVNAARNGERLLINKRAAEPEILEVVKDHVPFCH